MLEVKRAQIDEKPSDYCRIAGFSRLKPPIHSKSERGIYHGTASTAEMTAYISNVASPSSIPTD
jgi:hypothetical protein